MKYYYLNTDDFFLKTLTVPGCDLKTLLSDFNQQIFQKVNNKIKSHLEKWSRRRARLRGPWTEIFARAPPTTEFQGKKVSSGQDFSNFY